MNLKLLTASASILLLSSCLTLSSDSLQKAEELSRQGRYEQAIAAYRRHIDQRLKLKRRPQWENPYFYLVLIGDIELGCGNVSNALAAYEEAEEHGVYTALVSDRFRSVAEWYVNNHRLEEAFDLLKRYRTRDPLLFDAMLDRIAREIVRREDETAL